MTTLVAAMPMYDWAEVREETDRAWSVLRERLRAAGIPAPARLARRNADLPPVPGGIRDAGGRIVAPDPAALPPDEFDLPTLWRHPGLLIAQTCWGPMQQGLSRDVAVVGQGDYSGIPGGEGELYSSAILMRTVSSFEDAQASRDWHLPLDAMANARLAFNGPDSMSGFIALQRDLEEAGANLGIFSLTKQTGAHRASLIAVAEGRADVCAIDCRTWSLARHFEPQAAKLAVVGWTKKRLGLPFVTAGTSTPELQRILRQALLGPEG